jgi:DNA-binding YbaB/EbfC family protein
VNIQKMMRQAQQMQEKMQRELAAAQIEASAGGGVVTVVVNGLKEIQSVTIDPEVLDPSDPTMVQDLIVAALREASRKVDETMQSKLGALTGGMPGLF